MTRPPGSIELLIRLKNGTCTGGDMVAWAERALSDGFDSPSLRRLAGLDHGASLSDAQPLYDRAVLEMELQFPESADVLHRAYLRIIARQIVNGERTPACALDIIHSHVINPLNHPADLMPWCYLWEGNDPEFLNTLDDDAIAEKTRALAKALIEP